MNSEFDNIERPRAEELERLLKKERVLDKQPIEEFLINNFPFPRSFLFKVILRLIGIKIGKDIHFLGRVKVKLRGKPSNVIFEDNVTIGKNADFRNRENGKIILRKNSYVDDGVRIVAARDGIVEIGEWSEIGSHTVINSGGITKIGKFCMIAGNVNINSSSHGMAKSKFIKDQPHVHGTITIGNDVWIGASASVGMNCTIGEGAVIGTNAVVTGEIPPFAVCVGVPARVIKYRS